MSSNGYRRNEPTELDFPVEEPSILPDMIRLHVEDLGYEIQDLSRILHVSDDDLKSLYPMPEQNVSHLRIIK